MTTLNVELRNKLEKVIIEARVIAEAGARAALEALAVHHYEAFGHLSPELRRLRNHLRARARQLGDTQDKRGILEINRLVHECAYEYWHRMLFARFLAENDLLIEPDLGMAISLEECEDLAREAGTDLWTLASRYAQQMLPQIFRSGDPVLQVGFAREHKLKLEQLLDSLEVAVFKASDSLGWVYQFWQSKRKKQINESGNKIGPDELPVVTQLFTESYMVNFLIHNTIGAWYAGRVLAANPELAQKALSEEELRQAVSLPGVSWDYLRFVNDDDGKGLWRPAAGTFDGWPKSAAKLKILEPCCGSGHFLVALLRHLVPLRIAEEGLSVQAACDAVIKDNLHGLEIDERCTHIAVFALALAVWTYPSAEGYRQLPNSRIACSGIAPNAKIQDWLNLAGKDQRLREGMERLYELFKEAPILGSLIDPGIAVEDNLLEAHFYELLPLLKKALVTEKKDFEQIEMRIAALGIADAVEILGGLYHLIITNVPYLARGKQSVSLQDFCAKHYKEAKNDLANVFLDRLLKTSEKAGTTALVLPQNWLFLTSYKKLRKRLLKTKCWNIVVKLGTGAFDTISGEVVNVALIAISNTTTTLDYAFTGIDATASRSAYLKADCLLNGELRTVVQYDQSMNQEALVTISKIPIISTTLGQFCSILQGSSTGDEPRFVRYLWEFNSSNNRWKRFLSAPDEGVYSGRNNVWDWSDDCCELSQSSAARIQGLDAIKKRGFFVSGSKRITASIYKGEHYSKVIATVLPFNPLDELAIWAFLESKVFESEVRKLDQKILVTPGVFARVPFDLGYWKEIAAMKYPEGIPEPYSDDPTQWIFHGHPAFCNKPLQVALARLLDYSWPAESDSDIELSIEANNLISSLPLIEIISDDGGIVCIPSVRGEDTATERLRVLLGAAFGDQWSAAKEKDLIASTGSTAKDLDEWLRNDFFEQHCKLFHHRPFIWHIWDGRKRDGFHALVNYHKLAEGEGKGRKLLESLTYSYLGEWIARQKDGLKRGEDGAEARLIAAEELQKRLISILEGEPPFDIFVRWKPIEKQPLGWEPDINDGVRLNIRPFMASDIPGGRRGAGVLRWKPNISWTKDRGKEPPRPLEQFPWFWKDGNFVGDRVNDVHITNEEKRRARKEVRGSGSED